MKTHGIILITACTLFITIGQLFLKQGMANNAWIYVIIGLGFFGFGFLFLVHGLKHGEVTTLLPVMATSYIWVMIFAHILFDEPLGILKIIGTISIVIGIFFTNIGGKQ